MSVSTSWSSWFNSQIKKIIPLLAMSSVVGAQQYVNQPRGWQVGTDLTFLGPDDLLMTSTSWGPSALYQLANGTILWQTTFSPPLATRSIYHSRSQGTVIISGSTSENSISEPFGELALVGLNQTTGEVLWQAIIPGNETFLAPKGFNSVTEDSAGRGYAVGLLNGTGFQCEFEPATGNMTECKTANGADNIKLVKPFADGSRYVAGEVDGDVYVDGTDANGNAILSIRFARTGQDTVNDLQVGIDNSLLLAGTSLTKMNSSGNIDFSKNYGAEIHSVLLDYGSGDIFISLSIPDDPSYFRKNVIARLDANGNVKKAVALGRHTEINRIAFNDDRTKIAFTGSYHGGDTAIIYMDLDFNIPDCAPFETIDLPVTTVTSFVSPTDFSMDWQPFNITFAAYSPTSIVSIPSFNGTCEVASPSSSGVVFPSPSSSLSIPPDVPSDSVSSTSLSGSSSAQHSPQTKTKNKQDSGQQNTSSDGVIGAVAGAAGVAALFAAIGGGFFAAKKWMGLGNSTSSNSETPTPSSNSETPPAPPSTPDESEVFGSNNSSPTENAYVNNDWRTNSATSTASTLTLPDSSGTSSTQSTPPGSYFNGETPADPGKNTYVNTDCDGNIIERGDSRYVNGNKNDSSLGSASISPQYVSSPTSSSISSASSSESPYGVARLPGEAPAVVPNIVHIINAKKLAMKQSSAELAASHGFLSTSSASLPKVTAVVPGQDSAPVLAPVVAR